MEIFDALTTARPYQEKMTPDEALSHMRDLVGTTIDPGVQRALEVVIQRRQTLVLLDDVRR